MAKINKTYIAEQLYKTDGLEKGVRNRYTKLVDDTFEIIQKALLSGKEVYIPEIGSIKVITKKPRIAHNPRTLEKIKVGSKKTLRLRVSKTVKDLLNK